MAQKKSYSRYFIILQEDEKGYALASDKLPSGYAKLEIKNDKCKISYYVQNLKKESAPYFMILICNKKDVKKIIKVGELNIDDHGRAEVCHEYPVESVANCNIGMDKIIGAGIVKFMNSSLIPVMSGFASTDIPDWRNFTIVEGEKNRVEAEETVPVEKTEKKKAERAEDKIEKKAEEVKIDPRNVFDEYEKQIDDMKDKGKIKDKEDIKEKAKREIRDSSEKSVQDNIERNADEAPKAAEGAEKAEETEKLEEIDGEETRHKKKEFKKSSCNIKGEKECKDKKEKDECKEDKYEHKEEKCKEEKHEHKEEKCKEGKQYEYKYESDVLDNYCNKYYKMDKEDYPKGSVGVFFKDLAQGFEELDGICTEIRRCRWYKVHINRPEDMTNCTDYNKYTVVYYPMMNYYPYIKRYRHFVLGYKCDKENRMKYLVYGIPGTKSRLDQPFGGRSGFVTWVPLREGEEDESSYGYWLMFYDFRNSTIVIPVR